MIGLGSNRLTVCRRGGMRVTQAGRGGMEWLAGWRRPSWASPYSAQATAALKAQFPTQWPTIRDYGFAHPALVPFINEDPMMVMSLIEGLGTRWLVGDGASWVLINGFTIDKDKWLTKFRYKLGNIAGCPIGSRNMNNSMRGFNTLYTSGRFDSKGESTGYSASGTIGILIDEDYTLVELTNKKVRQYRNSIGTYTDYAKNETGQTQNYSLSPCLCVFGVHTRDGSVDTVSQVGNMKVSVAEFRDAATDGNKLLEIIPFKSATREGMVDVINATFHPNQGTGHFTTEEVFAAS